MALSNLAGWTEEKSASACGAACGASDKPAETPAHANGAKQRIKLSARITSYKKVRSPIK